MKTRVVLSMLVLLAAATCVRGGDDEQKGRAWCDISGTWYADAGSTPWIATFSRTSFARGLLITQWTGGSGDWYGYCAGSVATSNGMGTWTQKGTRTLLYTVVSFSLDAAGEVVCIWKMSGHIQLEPDCNSGLQNGSTELFDPGTNPFTDEPYHWFPTGEGTRFVKMTVDPVRY